MKTHLRIWGLCLLLGLSSPVGLQAQTQRVHQQPQTTEQGVSEGKLRLYSESIIGKTVFNPQGDELGRLTQLVVDAATGQVTHITLAVSGTPDLPQKTVLVPWQAVEVMPGGKRIRVHISQNELGPSQHETNSRGGRH